MVIWITGLSASGKTTLGLEMYNLLKDSGAWVFLDGDTMRTIFGEDLGHSIADRMKNAYRISNLCYMLDTQGINVLSCVLLISDEVRNYNKEHFQEYKEVFIDVSMETLISRDNKQLYKKALKGNLENVVGVDMKYDHPMHPDFTFNNNAYNIDFTKKSIEIIEALGLSVEKKYTFSKKNRLQYPEKYEYTQYKGSFFLDAYEKNRKNMLTKHLVSTRKIENVLSSWQKMSQGTVQLLFDIYISTIGANIDVRIFKLIQRFEVSKKIYADYNFDTWKRTSEEFLDVKNYLMFGVALINAYHKTENNGQKLILFNTLLKLNDLLISLDIQIKDEQEVLAYCIGKELDIYCEVCKDV